MQPHRWQPTRLPGHWDSPGKNTGVGCHFLFQCMKVKVDSALQMETQLEVKGKNDKELYELEL